MTVFNKASMYLAVRRRRSGWDQLGTLNDLVLDTQRPAGPLARRTSGNLRQRVPRVSTHTAASALSS